MLAHSREHRLDRSRQIRAVLAKEVLEQLQAVSIHQLVQDHRIVERASCKIAVCSVVERQRAELVLRRPEEVFTVIERRGGAVGLAQLRREAYKEIGEQQRIAPV